MNNRPKIDAERLGQIARALRAIYSTHPMVMEAADELDKLQGFGSSMSVEHMPPERRREMLAALIARLEKCRIGETYPLDRIERWLILDALRRDLEEP